MNKNVGTKTVELSRPETNWLSWWRKPPLVQKWFLQRVTPPARAW